MTVWESLNSFLFLFFLFEIIYCTRPAVSHIPFLLIFCIYHIFPTQILPWKLPTRVFLPSQFPQELTCGPDHKTRLMLPSLMLSVLRITVVTQTMAGKARYWHCCWNWHQDKKKCLWQVLLLYCFTVPFPVQKGKGKFWSGKVNEMHNFHLANSTKYQSSTAVGVTEKQYLSAMPRESL